MKVSTKPAALSFRKTTISKLSPTATRSAQAKPMPTSFTTVSSVAF